MKNVQKAIRASITPLFCRTNFESWGWSVVWDLPKLLFTSFRVRIKTKAMSFTDLLTASRDLYFCKLYNSTVSLSINLSLRHWQSAFSHQHKSLYVQKARTTEALLLSGMFLVCQEIRHGIKYCTIYCTKERKKISYVIIIFCSVE